MNQGATRDAAVILAATDITFAYPARPLFQQWTHAFGSGITWLQGHNGDGKSTLLRIIAGALKPRLGSLVIQGTSIAQDPLGYRRQLFWCGPGALPLNHLTPVEYFRFMAHLYPGFSESEVNEHVAAFALQPHLDIALSRLSTGTQRKVWISAALSAGTAVVLLDEPFNALDADSTRHLRAALAVRAQDCDRAWIVVSHEHFGPAADHAAVLSVSSQAPAHVLP